MMNIMITIVMVVGYVDAAVAANNKVQSTSSNKLPTLSYNSNEVIVVTVKEHQWNGNIKLGHVIIIIVIIFVVTVFIVMLINYCAHTLLSQAATSNLGGGKQAPKACDLNDNKSS